jgi:hypothetical protein
MCPWCCEDLDDCQPCEGRLLWWLSQYGIPFVDDWPGTRNATLSALLRGSNDG